MKLLRKLRALFRREKLDAEMSEEMRHHLDAQMRRNLAAGMSLDEARYAAQREFGGVDQIKERCRDQRGFRWVEYLRQDLRHGVRGLRKNPGFAVVAILTLALGIGANTAIFTAVNAVMLRPLPVPKPARLAYITSGSNERFSYAFYERLRDQAKSFAGLSAVQAGTTRREFIAPGATAAEAVTAQLATGNFFSGLGVAPHLGRVFGPEDDRPGAAQSVIAVSYAFWQRRFGADPSIVGQVVRVAGVPVTIVGVMPAGFAGFQVGANPDLWAPLQLGPQWDADLKGWLAEDWISWLIVFGRLRDDVSHEQAGAEAQIVFRRHMEARVALQAAMERPARERILSQTLELHSGAAGYVALRSQFQRPLAILMATVGAVLLLVCTNVAGLLLARGASRQREFALRAALGAGRGRIFRQLLTESLLLALLGGVSGFIFAQWGTSFLARFLADSGNGFALQPDGRVLLFMIAVSLSTGVLFGFLPALQLSRLDLVSVLKNQDGRGGGPARHSLPTLVGLQIVLSVTLLTGAGLLIQTLHNLRTLDLGFQPENVVSFTVSLQGWRPDFAQTNAVMRRVLSELETLPGAQSVTIGGGGILSGDGHLSRFSVDGYAPAPDEEMRASVVLAGSRFFETLKVPLRGREFQPGDELAPTMAGVPQRASVAILSETMARKFFGDANPVGRSISLTAGSGTRLEVIGVAGDTKYARDLRATPPLEIYQPYFGAMVALRPTFYVRTAQSAAALAPELRRLVTRVDSRLAVGSPRALDEVIDRLLVRERTVAQLVGFFSVFALLLASLGIYGMLSYGVAQRTREIGVRMALGASVRDVIGLVLRQGLTLTLVGCAGGIAGALLLSRWIASQLYGVEPADPLTFAAVTGLLLAVTLFACWLPARRAAKVDPMVALRAE